MRLKHIVVGLILSSAAFSAHAQTSAVRELRIVQPTNGNSFVLLPGASTVQQNVTLPAALPSSTGQVLNVSAVSGSNVTLTWAAGGGGGGGAALTARQTADQVNNGAWANANIAVTPTVNKSYAITGVVRLATSDAAQDPQLRFTVPAGATISVTVAATRSGGPAVNSADATTPITVDNDAVTQQTYVVSGTLTMGATAGNVTLQFQRAGAIASATIGGGSYLLFSATN